MPICNFLTACNCSIISLFAIATTLAMLAIVWANTGICYHLGICHSKSLPYIDRFVGREEDIRNITGYLDFANSDVQVVHIVGPPGFGKSTLAIKIGDIFVRKGLYVHYVDVRTVSDMDTLAEKAMFSIVESVNKKVTFDRLEKWVRKQYSNTLIILDNCDELLEKNKGEFLEGIKSLLAFSRRLSVRYLLTSQKWVADIGNFRLHPIYNLSFEASIQLLGRLAPSLTNEQKMKIATLTGNVPLALKVVGAIFNFPDAPVVEEVIQGLEDNPVSTLSPSKLHSTVEVSIGVAYSYLTSNLQQLCINLSHFPGSFNVQCAFDIFGTDVGFHTYVNEINILVQRSLLQFNSATKRYHFHPLIQNYFHQVTNASEEALLKQYFEDKFQLYFADTLERILQLTEEKHNLQYMFNLFKTAKHVSSTFIAVQMTVYAMRRNILQMYFVTGEINNISLNMLTALESYTYDEQKSVELFYETYSQVVMLVAKQQHEMDIVNAIHILSQRRGKIVNGLVRSATFINFFSMLAKYYKEVGDDKNAAMCHTHILSIIHKELKHCSPNCDFYSISIAYENIRDGEQAFKYRELAHKYQLHSLSPIKQAELYIDLYYDYTNGEYGDNTDKATNFSTVITERIYIILMNANRSTYSEKLEVYYAAITFFMEQNLKERAVQLQYKMLKADQIEQCVVTDRNHELCSKDIFSHLKSAWERKHHHLVIGLGKIVFQNAEKSHPKLAMEAARLVGHSYFHRGNYTASHLWLKRALYIFNKALKAEFSFELSQERGELCIHLLQSGDINVFCYGYIIKHIIVLIPLAVKYEFWNIMEQPQKVILSKVTDLTVQEYSYIWSQFVDRVRSWSWVLEAINFWYNAFLKLVVILLVLYIIYCVFPCILICCIGRSRNRVCKYFTFGSICIMVLFVLGLDWIY